ncbi:MAG: glycerol-3-phosphate acyltransferase [Chloroflexota bacterium]
MITPTAHLNDYYLDALTFLISALPFSVWIGRYGLKKDITQYGDKNPGATNVLRAGGYAWFAGDSYCNVSRSRSDKSSPQHIFGWRRPALFIIGTPATACYLPFTTGAA